VNPKLPDWREDIRRCHEEYRMPGIRLHPNYHGYKLDDPHFAELLTLAERRGLIVQLVVGMEDTRTQHTLLQVPDVDVEPLVELLPARPQLRLVVLNGMRSVHGALLNRLIEAGEVYFDIATLEGVGGVTKLLQTMPVERLLFGSHLPLFHVESALLKLRESDLPTTTRDAITHQNAIRLLQRSRDEVSP
jgi:predicted TIM-barrel fold metal-dependent hydrolase